MLHFLPLDTSGQLISGFFRCSGSLFHLRSLTAAMNQNPPLLKSLNLSGRRSSDNSSPLLQVKGNSNQSRSSVHLFSRYQMNCFGRSDIFIGFYL